MNRLYIFISFLFLTLLICSPMSLTAEAPINVLDCLEDEDCLELDDFEKNEQQEMNEGKHKNEGENELLENDQFSTGSLIINVLKMIFALLLVLALIYLLVKLLGRRRNLSSQIKSLENMGGISVGQQKSIQVIRVGRRFYLVGVGENVELLQEITDIEMIEDLLAEQSGTDDSLKSMLPSFLQKGNESDREESDNFKEQFKEELNKIKQQRRTFIDQYTEKEDEHD